MKCIPLCCVSRIGLLWTLSLFCFVLADSACGIDDSVPAINGHVSRLHLGDGTGVVIGIIDSGVESSHPSLAGVDSLGQPRLVAESNFVPSEPGNTGDDVAGHGTWVASVALSSDPTFTGLATDARFINARVLDNDNSFGSDGWVRNGIGFAIGQGADILNLSLNFFGVASGGDTQLDLMIDWAATQGIHSAICVGNISQGSGTTSVRGPGSAYNGVTVGRTDGNFRQVHSDSATAFTSDGRMKPDVVAPGTGLTLANDDFELGGEPLWDKELGGCSFATPHVAGMMAQQLDAGSRLQLSTHPLVVKSTILNSTDHSVLSRNGNLWSPATSATVGDIFTVLQPLDTEIGTGQIDGARLSSQYLAGEQAPGIVDEVGWDLNTVGGGQTVDYHIDDRLMLGSVMTTTLSWLRDVSRIDGGSPGVDAEDRFTQVSMLDNLDLQILRNGVLIAESMSSSDNVEHLNVVVDQLGDYTLRVVGSSITGASAEQFGLAWYATAVPEPCGALLLMMAVFGLAMRAVD